MSLSTTVSDSINAAGISASGAIALTTDALDVRDIALTSLQANVPVALAFNVEGGGANSKRLWILSDQAVLLETNSDSVPDNTISLLAGRPYAWDLAGYFVNPVDTDVAEIFLTNAFAGAARVQIFSQIDGTV